MRFTPNDNSTDISGLRFPESATSSTAPLLKSTGRALGDGHARLMSTPCWLTDPLQSAKRTQRTCPGSRLRRTEPARERGDKACQSPEVKAFSASPVGLSQPRASTEWTVSRSR